MKIKSHLKTYFLVVCCVVLGVLFVRNGLQGKQTPQTSVEQESVPASVVTINDATRIVTGREQAKTPFEALSFLAKKNNIPVVTKSYDFGIFVQSIGDKESGSEMAWIYYVNGAAGNVASDKYELKENDSVEWKYEKSIY